MRPNLQSEKPEMLRVRSLPQNKHGTPKGSTFSRPACASMLRPFTHWLFVGREELDLYSGPYISSIIMAQFLFFPLLRCAFPSNKLSCLSAWNPQNPKP